MRVVLSIAAVALLLLTVAPGFAAESAQVNLGNVELSYDNGLEGPLRDDPGPDWITYDNGQAQGLITGAAYWTKVNFLPNGPFRLHAIRFLPLNQGNNQDRSMRLRVYSIDQQSLDLDEVLFEETWERLPAWNAQNLNANWILFELNHDDLIDFDAREQFAILYECPGGAYGNPPGAGTGWWNLYDGADNGGRSFYGVIDAYGDDPPAAHDDWSRCNGDLLLRANGEYLEDFVDLNIVCAYNEEDMWTVLPGAEIQYKVDVSNIWGDYGENFNAVFTLTDPDGNEVWENAVRQNGIDGGDTLTLEASEAYTVPDDAVLGLYKLWVTLEVADDSDLDNNEDGMDQMVVNPAADGGDPDQWWTYIDGMIESITSWNEDSGWSAAFWHPGGPLMMAMPRFRVLIVSFDEALPLDVDMEVFRLDLTANPPLTSLWAGTARITGEEDGREAVGNDRGIAWTIVEPDYENPDEAVIGEGQAFMAVYYFRDGTQFPSDTDPPIAGTNTKMQPAYLTTANDGGSFGYSSSGDYPIEAQMEWSGARPPGRHLMAIPNELNFGDEALVFQDHVIVVDFISFGREPVTISQIRPAPAIAGFLQINPIRDIEIATDDTVQVTFTFNTSYVDTFDNSVMVQNDSVEPNLLLLVHVITTESITEHTRPGIPSAYELSQNHPNPFNPVTTVDFALTKAGQTRLDVFDLSGRLVKNVFQGNLPMGYHSAKIDATDLPAGVYLYKLTSADFTSAHKMALVK